MNIASAVLYFFLNFFIKTYAIVTHFYCLTEAIQMSTNSICFYKEMDKNIQAVICLVHVMIKT